MQSLILGMEKLHVSVACWSWNKAAIRKSTKGEWIALALTAVWAIIVVVSVYKAYNP
jgi:hypothetical protein